MVLELLSNLKVLLRKVLSAFPLPGSTSQGLIFPTPELWGPSPTANHKTNLGGGLMYKKPVFF